MARYALLALLALALCAAPAMALDVSGNSIIITRASAGSSLPVFDNSWLTNMTYNGTTGVCVGQILYAVKNDGDSAISPYVYGPIKVSGPPGLFLVSPRSFQYMTTAVEGTQFAAGVEITNVGYYAAKGQTTVFALTMGCNITYNPDTPPSGACVCPGADTISFAATTNTSSGKTADVCGVNGNPGKLLDVGVCVTVKRQNQTTNGLDQYWTDGHQRCIGHTLFTITNHGLSPINQLSTNSRPLRIAVGNSTEHRFYYPQGSVSGECCEYNYFADDLVANGTSVTVVDAGFYMLPGASSTFAVTTWCKAACPCTGASFDVIY